MRKILIVGPSWVGDMVVAQCLFKTLARAASPESDPSGVEIRVLAPEWSMPLLARMPEVAGGIRMPLRHGELGLRARRRLGHSLREDCFEHAIVLPGSFKSALVPWFAKIPRRTGYLGEQRWGLLNDIRALERRALPSLAQRFVALGLPKSANAPAPADIPRPSLAPPRAQAEETAARFGLSVEESPVVAMCPGAEYGPAKRWPEEHFAAVAEAQLARGRQVWLFGSPNDREIAARINQLCGGRCADLSGRTMLGEAVDLLSLAERALCNDSGLMHIAAAVGCRVVALYGSSDAVFTPPLAENCARLSLNLACSPCFKRECPLGHLDCLRKLPPQRAEEALE
ncbi:MAG: lipopolysaccharide heptosyltransferase II [Gammaproteobacteria bacterium]|nr:lipopolysaccharide heptosyltransferase II [Gammaproteobacteria bacterium]